MLQHPNPPYILAPNEMFLAQIGWLNCTWSGRNLTPRVEIEMIAEAGYEEYTLKQGRHAMIVKAKEAQNREFMGVPFVLHAVGEHSMVTKMHYRAGVRGAGEHSHINEQSGYVISGKYRLRMEHFDGGGAHVHGNEASTEAKQWDDIILQPGDSYSIPGKVIHSFEVMEPGEVIDFFTPPRTDFLSAAGTMKK